MKTPRHTERQIAQALRQAEQGTPVVELCRKLGVSETPPRYTDVRLIGATTLGRKTADPGA